MTTQDILKLLTESPDHALELCYDGYDKTVCWCYVASDGVPTVYWNLLDQERITDSALLEAMLKDGPGVHKIPVSDLIESQRTRVRKDIRRMRSEDSDDAAMLEKLESTVNSNLWRHVSVDSSYAEPRRVQYLAGATVSDEDCYWLTYEPDGHVSFNTAAARLTFEDDILSPSDELVQKIRANLDERLASTCDVVVAGPFAEEL